MTGMENLTIPDDAFLNALRKIEASYQEDQNGINDNIILLDENKHNVGANKTLACSCVITLCKILDNIILEKKYNAKTRSIKLSNKLFKDKVGKVQGGVDFMMACKFTYNTVQPEQGHSIQLKKQNEDRNMLIMGRKYLDEYGQQILKLNLGKQRNELPPYLIRDPLDKNLQRMINDGIKYLVDDKLTNLEHEISSIIGDEDTFDLETNQLVDALEDIRRDEKESNSPSTPETDKTDGSCEDKDVKKAIVIISSPDQNGSSAPHVKDDILINKDKVAEVNANEEATEEETMEKSQHSTKSIDLESVGNKSEYSSAILDDVVNNEEICPSPVHKSFDTNNDQINLIDIQCLSPEQKVTLKKLTSINLEGLDENEAIISIIEGNDLNQIDKRSRSYNFVTKLRNIRGRRKKESEEVKAEKCNDQNYTEIIESTTIPQIRIKESEDVRKIYKRDKSKDGADKTNRINIAEELKSVRFEKTLSQDEENAIRTGIKFFFTVYVEIFSESNLHDELNICPIEIVFRLWKAILRTERDLFGVQTNKILEALEALVVGNVVDDYQIGDFETLAGIDQKICNYFQALMTDIGILQIEIRDQSYIKGDLDSGFTFTSIALKKDQDPGEIRKEITNQIFPELDKKSSKWHDIIVRGCNEILNFDVSTEELYNDPEPSNKLSIWYATRYLPYHIRSRGSYKDALALLVDKKFIIHRINSCGCTPATIQHLKDTIITTELMKEQDNKNSVNLDYQQAALKAIQEQILEILEERKKDVDDLLLRSKAMNPEDTAVHQQKAYDIGCAMQKLGASFGKAGLFQKEIDIYSEALRLKFASNCSDSKYADTLLSMSVCYRKLDNPLSALTRLNEVINIETKLHGETHENICTILQYKGFIQCEIGEFHQALLCFQKTLRIQKSLNLANGIVITLCCIGKIQQELGDFHLALDSFQTAKSSLDMIEHEENLRHAEILQNIGIVYYKMDQLQESLHYLYEGLRIRRSILRDNNSDVGETLSFIATVLKKKDLEKSLILFRIVLNMKLKYCQTMSGDACEELLQAYSDILVAAKEMLRIEPHNKDLHYEITMLFFSVGNIYEKLYRYKTAISYYNKSLKLQKVHQNFYEIGNVLNSLGIAHAKRQSFKKATRCLSDCLSVRKLILGERNMEVAEALHNMGNCFAKQRDFDNAALNYEQSLIIKKIIDSDSLSAAKTLHTIGMVNEELGLLDDAFKYYEDAYKIRLHKLGEDSLDVSFSLHSIGLVHRKNNDTAKANECFTKALQIKKQHYFMDHLSIAETLYELGTTNSKSNQLLEAIDNYLFALTIYQKHLGAHKTTVKILDSLGSLFLSTEQYNKSYRHLERALALKRILYGNDDEEVSNTLHIVGKVQGKSGDVDDALESLKEALRIRKKIYDDDSLPVAAIINDVGVLQLKKNQYQIAKTCFTEALRVWKLKLDDNHDYHGEALMNLAEIDYLSGDYDNAITKLTEALKLMKANFGDRHVAVGLIYYKLGLSFKTKEAYIEGLDALERSLAIRSDEYGQDSQPVAEVLKCIGELCLAMGEFAKARNYLGESLKIMNDVAKNDFDTVDTLYSLGKVMAKMRYFDEALTYYEDALDIRSRRLQSDDSINADIMTDVGIIYEEKQQYEESLNMYDKALKVRIALFGENSSIGDSYHMIGNIQQTMNDYDAALSNFGSALIVYQNTIGDDHLSCAKTMNNIGIIYEAINELGDSLKYHREALRIRKKNLGRDHLKVANSLDNIAGVYQKQNNIDKACSALKEALRIRIAKLGNDHLEVGTTLFGMGILYCDKGDLHRAMDCYEASLKIRKRRVGSSSIEVAQTIFNIGSLHAMKEDYNDALNSWRSALEIYRINLPDDHHMVACAIGNIQMAENVLSGGA